MNNYYLMVLAKNANLSQDHKEMANNVQRIIAPLFKLLMKTVLVDNAHPTRMLLKMVFYAFRIIVPLSKNLLYKAHALIASPINVSREMVKFVPLIYAQRDRNS